MMVIRLALLVGVGVACWKVTSRCLSKKIVDFHFVHVVESQSPKRERTTPTTTYPKWNQIDPTTYTYDHYLFDIPEKMVKSEKEYQLRKQIFEENLAVIQSFNIELQGGGHNQHQLGLNQFMDQFPEELPRPGYAKHQNDRWNANAIDDSILSVSDADTKTTTATQNQFDYWTMIHKLTTEDSNLPKHVDWRIDSTTGKPLATPVKAQGRCGSCWAFATTAALESHVALASENKTLMSLSMQELVSCVPNSNNCGGNGGCGGSTAELALDFVRQRGLVDEWHFGYQSYSGTNPASCSLHEKETTESASKFFEDAVVTVQGFVQLPPNNYTALVHAVATSGPVIVNVAASPWRFYERGVFTPRGHSTDQTDINHVVVLMGYGTDEETGEDYWLVRNSYGPQWGEDGYIRLKRVDPTTLPQPDADCGMDVKPADGIACTEDNTGHHITPPAVRVCGTSGILFDPVLPVGARLL